MSGIFIKIVDVGVEDPLRMAMSSRVSFGLPIRNGRPRGDGVSRSSKVGGECPSDPGNAFPAAAEFGPV